MLSLIFQPLFLCVRWLYDVISWCTSQILLPEMTMIRKGEKLERVNACAPPSLPVLFLIRYVVKKIFQGEQNEYIMKVSYAAAKCFPKQGLCKVPGIGAKDKIFVFKPEIAQAVMSAKPGYIYRLDEYQTLHYVMAGITSIDDPVKWRVRRKLAIPWFHNENLDGFVPGMNKHTRMLVHRLRQRIADPINIYSYVHDFALDVSFQSILGYELAFQKPTSRSEQVKEAIHELTSDPSVWYPSPHPIQPILHPDESISATPATFTIRCVFRIASLRPMNPLFFNDYVFSLFSSGRKYFRSVRYLHNFLRQVIRERQQNSDLLAETSRTVDGRSVSMLDFSMRLQAGNKADSDQEEDLIDVIVTGIFGTEDTSHHALSMALLLIGHHPEVQSKIHQELDEVFMGDRERPITLEDIKQLEYLQCVIKETLRLYPPGHVVGFRVSPPGPFKIDGYEFKPRTDFLISIWQIHRDPTYFPSPERFIPERFMPISPFKVPKHPYTFLPFSGGPRKCMGSHLAYNTMSVALADILRNYSVQSLDKRDELKFTYGVVVDPIVPLRAYFIPRSLNSCK